MTHKKKVLGILLGDPSGIGPELISKIISHKILNKINVIIIGDKHIFEKNLIKFNNKININFINNSEEMEFTNNGKNFLNTTKNKINYPIGKVSKNSGLSVLNSIDMAVKLFNQKKLDGINFAPFNKTSLDLAGMKFKDELHYFKKKFKIKSYVCELNVLNNFWTARVTSHIPLKDVPKKITIKNILKPIKLINNYLKMNGLKNPKIAVQALNPHAEFGSEEKTIITPAIKQAKRLKINTYGPLPCDTSFIKAYKNKEFDCLIGMYHDAIQSGLKSFGFDKGVTVQGGLPIPITTPAHGTAFDIVDKNQANVNPTLESLKLLIKLTSYKKNLLNLIKLV